MATHDVLIIGAGPTGLVLALWLTKLGVSVRIIDKAMQPGTTSRALAVHARTLELYRQLDLADAVIEKGHKVPAINFWVAGQKKARLVFDDIGGAVTPYPFLHIFPQDEHERLLIARLETLDVKVERSTELVSYVDNGNGIHAVLRNAAGEEQHAEVAYIAGCDGARSLVRGAMHTGFPGGTYEQVFYVADVEADGPPIDGELHADLDEADFVAIFPLAGQGRARLIGTVKGERAVQASTLQFSDISDRAIRHLKLNVKKVNWFSTYHVHHRVTTHFRKGRAFLLGDAAHIHSPAGGQGMNTGIGDAINLAWKLHAVLTGRAPDTLLDSYEADRIAFARALVNTTDRAFTVAASTGPIADFIRIKIVPHVISFAAKFKGWREWMFRMVSQTSIRYRNSPLSEGSAGKIHGGDRLPWVVVNGIDNTASLTAMIWQVHVYGAASLALASWCRANNISLHTFVWHSDYEKAGFARDGMYLLRPDSYVALADPANAPDIIERYFARRGIKLY